MIAIHHEIDFTHFIYFNGWQACACCHECRFDICPTLLIAGIARQEGAREIGITTDTAHDGIDGNELYAAFGAGAQFWFLSDIVIRKKLIDFPEMRARTS
jgi:hypothetical protein